MNTRRGNGEGSIYKRKDGRWVGVINVGYEGGKRRRKHFYGDTRRQVAQKLRAGLSQQAGGLPLPDERTRMGSYLQMWLDEVAAPRLRPSTFASYEMICRRHLIPVLGHLRLTEVNPQTIQKYLNKKSRDNLSARTVQYHHAVLRTALDRAESWGLVPRNAARLATPPTVQRPEIQPPSMDQAQAILAAVKHERLKPVYLLAMATGARVSELLGLAWDDVTLNDEVVTIRAKLEYLNGVFSRSEPKTSASRRTVAIPSPVVDGLRAWKIRQLEERLSAGPAWVGNPWNLVFTQPTGAPISRYTVSRGFTRILRREGLPHIRFHDLRHATATYMLGEGVELKVVQQVLGHAKIGVTANTYAHVVPALQRDAARRLGNVLWGHS